MQYHQNSPLGQLETLRALPWCAVCSLWGGEQEKRRGRMLCHQHTPQRPRYRCTECDSRRDALDGGVVPRCHGPMEPYWSRRPVHLRGLVLQGYTKIAPRGYVVREQTTDDAGRPITRCARPTVPMYIVAQSVQASGLVRGLDTFEKACDLLGLAAQEVVEEALRLKGLGREPEPHALRVKSDVSDLLAQFMGA